MSSESITMRKEIEENLLRNFLFYLVTLNITVTVENSI